MHTPHNLLALVIASTTAIACSGDGVQQPSDGSDSGSDSHPGGDTSEMDSGGGGHGSTFGGTLGTISRVSLGVGGAQPNEQTYLSYGGTGNVGNISDDGRYVVYAAKADNLIASDTNLRDDVFLHDRVSGSIQRLSEHADGTPFTGGQLGSFSAAISGNGRYVYYSTSADNPPSGPGLYRVDLTTGAQSQISDRGCYQIATSQDGSHLLLFHSTYMTYLSPDSDPVDLDVIGAGSGGLDMSPDGRWVAFASAAPLLPEDDDNAQDIYRYDGETGELRLVSVDHQGNNLDAYTNEASISDDGRWVLFQSRSDGHVPGDTNAADDIFLHDMETGEITWVSVALDGSPLNNASHVPQISGDGSLLVFSTLATNAFGPADPNVYSFYDVVMIDRDTDTRYALHFAADGGLPQFAMNGQMHLTTDGKHLVFTSRAGDLVDGDTNGETGSGWDIFVNTLP